jgi:hypothetical protein
MAWMRTKCSSVTGGDPSADADGDGQKNLSENKAGTHPLNPLSVRIPSVGRQPDQSTTITFSSVSGKRHRAEYSTSLGAGATWYVLATDLNGPARIFPSPIRVATSSRAAPIASSSCRKR